MAQGSEDGFPAPPAELLAEEDEDGQFPEPPPDYELAAATERDYEGLIPPHKLPNPVLESKERMRLNNEIKLNAKRGINPLDSKPELQKELERRKFEQKKKEQLEHQRMNRSSLEQRLDEQKLKIDTREKEAEMRADRERKKSELERVHERISVRATSAAAGSAQTSSSPSAPDSGSSNKSSAALPLSNNNRKISGPAAATKA